MAERRMFAKTIIDSDAFLDMPLSSQALYFQLGMRADDDGFINNPKRIQRMIGASEDDLKLLMAKNFIIAFETGVIVIKHWKMNNYIQKDRYKETVYLEEKSRLDLKNNNAYTLNNNKCIQNVSNLYTQDSIGKYSIDKYNNDDEDIYTYYENNIGILTPRQYEIISSYIEMFNLDIIKEAINRASDNNAKTFKYVEGILKSWKQKGYKTLVEIQNEKKPKKEKDIPEWIDKKIEVEELDPLEQKKLEEEMSIFE